MRDYIKEISTFLLSHDEYQLPEAVLVFLLEIYIEEGKTQYQGYQHYFIASRLLSLLKTKDSTIPLMKLVKKELAQHHHDWSYDEHLVQCIDAFLIYYPHLKSQFPSKMQDCFILAPFLISKKCIAENLVEQLQNPSIEIKQQTFESLSCFIHSLNDEKLKISLLHQWLLSINQNNYHIKWAALVALGALAGLLNLENELKVINILLQALHTSQCYDHANALRDSILSWLEKSSPEHKMIILQYALDNREHKEWYIRSTINSIIIKSLEISALVNSIEIIQDCVKSFIRLPTLKLGKIIYTHVNLVKDDMISTISETFLLWLDSDVREIKMGGFKALDMILSQPLTSIIKDRIVKKILSFITASDYYLSLYATDVLINHISLLSQVEILSLWNFHFNAIQNPQYQSNFYSESASEKLHLIQGYLSKAEKISQARQLINILHPDRKILGVKLGALLGYLLKTENTPLDNPWVEILLAKLCEAPPIMCESICSAFTVLKKNLSKETIQDITVCLKSSLIQNPNSDGNMKIKLALMSFWPDIRNKELSDQVFEILIAGLPMMDGHVVETLMDSLHEHFNLMNANQLTRLVDQVQKLALISNTGLKSAFAKKIHLFSDNFSDHQKIATIKSLMELCCYHKHRVVENAYRALGQLANMISGDLEVQVLMLCTRSLGNNLPEIREAAIYALNKIAIHLYNNSNNYLFISELMLTFVNIKLDSEEHIRQYQGLLVVLTQLHHVDVVRSEIEHHYIPPISKIILSHLS